MPAKVYLSKSGYCRNDDLIRVREYILDSGAELVEHQSKPYNKQKAIDVDIVIVIGHKNSFDDRLFYTGIGVGGEMIRATGDVYIYKYNTFLWLPRKSIAKNSIYNNDDWTYKHYVFDLISAKKVTIDTLKTVMAGYHTKYPSDDYINKKKIYKEVDIKIDRIFGDFFKRKH